MTLAGAVTPSLLLLLTFMIGCGTAVLAPAWQASIGDIVPRSQIAPAVMANAVGFNLARSLGPAIGGAIVAAVGAAVAFIVNAVSYLGIIAALLCGNRSAYGAISPRTAGRRHRRWPALCEPVPPSARNPAALRVAVHSDRRGHGADADRRARPSRRRRHHLRRAAGRLWRRAMLGALGSAGLRRRFTSDTQLKALSALACVAMIAIGQSHWTALTLLAHVLAGSVWTLGFANFNIAVQLSSPRWVTGRMLATYQTIAFAGIAFGSWWWGELASAQGVRVSLTLAGLARPGLTCRCSLAAGVGGADRLAGSPSKTGADPSERRDPPGVGSDHRRNRVSRAAGACGEFAVAINELGRVRRRNGARGWSVSQDLDSTELWVERFESPTWTDHLRWRTRPTESDFEVRKRIGRLIVGEKGRVRRFVGRPPGAEPIGMVLDQDRTATAAGARVSSQAAQRVP